MAHEARYSGRNRPWHFKIAMQSLAACLSVALALPAYALGLGDVSVQSYLGQPLSARVALISNRPEELQGVTAGLASAESFQLIGLDRLALSVPLQFSVESGATPYIQVRSSTPVNDPVLRFVIEVEFANGRLLREYTLFLDPPSYKAPVPLPAITPARPAASVNPADEEPVAVQRPDQAPQDEASTAEPQSPPEPEPEPESELEPVAEPEIRPEPAATAESAAEEAAAPEVEQTQAPAAESGPMEREESAAPRPPVPTAAEPEDPVTRPAYQAGIEDFETYGPVERGETLWGIASDYAEDTDYTINQAMLAIQRYNPDAFAHGNINQLRRGAVLRLPPLTELALLSAREAMLEAMLQEQEYAQIRAGRTPEPRAPLYAERTAPPEVVGESAQDAEASDTEGRLELVPPHDAGAGVVEAAQGGSGEADAGTAEEPGGRLSEEEQANVEQESAYLSEQIEAMEAELGVRDTPLEVSDPGLAQMQQRLQDERARDEPEPPVAVTPPGPAEPWVERLGWWWLSVPLLLVGGVLFWLRRVRTPADDDTAGTVRMITSEAEKILHALDGDPDEAGATPAHEEPETRVIDLEHYKEQASADPAPEPASRGGSRRSGVGEPAIADADEPPSLVPPTHAAKGRRSADDEQAVELDADDPETKLDLARAYISMGESESARGLLAEVIECGNEVQVKEAREMLSEI